MRRGLRLLLMALCCAALCGVYALLGAPDAPTPATETTDATESTDAASSYFMLYEDAVSALESITVQPKGSDRYTVLSDMAFDQRGNLLGVYNALSQPFLVSGQPDFTLSATAWQMLLLTAQHIPATASYPALDRDACGLTDPDAIVTVTHRDGTQRVLRIGHLTSDGASCYVALDGDERVYLVPYDFHETMCQPLAMLHTLPAALNESVSSAVQIALTGTADGQLIFTKTSGSLMAWAATSPLTHAGSTERIEAFVTGLCAISADAYETTVEDASELAHYGLDAPRRLIAAFQDGTIRDIHLGSDAGDGYVYARMDRTGDIYRIRRTQLAFADNAGLDTLLDRFVTPVPVATLAQVRVTMPDAACTLRIEYDGDDDSLGQRYFRNDAAVSRDDFTDDYLTIIALQFDQTAPQDAQGTALLADVTFTLRDGGESSVRYEAYDAFYAIATTSGGGRFLVRLNGVQTLLNCMKGDTTP